MTEELSAARRMGQWASWSVLTIDLVYIAVGLASLAAAKGRPAPADPYLAILEILILLVAPLMVVWSAAVHSQAPPSARPYTLAGLAFMVVLAVVTSGIHFVQLTVIRHIGLASLEEIRAVTGLRWRWPNMAFSLDLMAWDIFFGLSMLFSASAFPGRGLPAAARGAMLTSGTLCVVGSLGPLLGDLRIQYLAIAGYAFVFLMVCLCTGLLFGREEAGLT